MGGAPLFGLLERSGVGAAVEGAPPPDVALLWQRRQRSNGELLASLKQDEFSAELMALTAKDARLGRMSWPVPVEEFSEQDLNALLLAPRFGVEQGLKDDGSVKVRAVDNFSWSCVPEECEVRRSKKVVKGVLCTSICAVYGGGGRSHSPALQAGLHAGVACAGDSINGHCMAQEKFAHDHLDDLVRSMTRFREELHVTPHLWKADINSAFRHAVQACATVCVCWYACRVAGGCHCSRHSAGRLGSLSSMMDVAGFQSIMLPRLVPCQAHTTGNG